MKLSQVVRGVEEKEKYDYDTDHASWGNADDSFREGINVGEVYGYNSLAQSEVVVDREKIVEPYLWEVYNAGVRAGKNGQKENEMARNFLELAAYDIATAIESGSIIRLKEE